MKEKIEDLSTSADDHKYKQIASYPWFPVKFKSKRWTCKIARKVLKDILEVEGFGSGSQKYIGYPMMFFLIFCVIHLYSWIWFIKKTSLFDWTIQ